MVRSPEAAVTVVCIPLEMVGIGASPAEGYVPFTTEIYGVVRRSDTLAGENGVRVYLYRHIPYGWKLVGETTSARKYDIDGWCEVNYKLTEEAEEMFYFANIGNKYCSFASPTITVRGRKKATELSIGASPANPAPDQPYDIYGRLWRTEPDTKYLNYKTVKLYESSDDGKTWSLVATLKTYTYNGLDGWWQKKIRKKEGRWKYYAEFEGDAEHSGCSQAGPSLGPSPDLGPAYFR